MNKKEGLYSWNWLSVVGWLMFIIFISGCTQPRQITYDQSIERVEPIATTDLQNTTSNTTIEEMPRFLKPTYGQFALYTFTYLDSQTHFIILPSNRTILIDITTEHLKQVSGFIKDLGFSKIDYLILTSEEPSRSSGAGAAILKLYPQTVFYNGITLPENMALYTHLQAIPYDKQLKFDNVTDLYILAEAFVPYDDGKGFISEQNNLMFRFRYGMTSVLLGSCKNDCEDRLGNAVLNADLFYLSNECGTSLYFMRKVKPSLVVYPMNACEKEVVQIDSIGATKVEGNVIQATSDGSSFDITRYNLVG